MAPVGKDNDKGELPELQTLPPEFGDVVLSSTLKMEEELTPIVPNSAALERCIPERVAGRSHLIALLVHIWLDNYDVRCVFKCRSGSLFAAFMPNGIPPSNRYADYDFEPGCSVMITKFAVFERIRTTKTSDRVLVPEMVILECQLHDKKLCEEHLVDKQIIYGFTEASILRAYRGGECILEIDGTVEKKYARVEKAVETFVCNNLRNVPAVDVQVTHQLMRTEGDDDEPENPYDVECTEPGLYDSRFEREYSVTKRRLTTRRQETVEVTLTETRGSAGCECKEKFGVLGCLVQLLPPEKVHNADSGTLATVRPSTLEVAAWEPSRFYHWYSRVLQHPPIDSTEGARSKCMETAVRDFVAAQQPKGLQAEQPQGPQGERD